MKAKRGDKKGLKEIDSSFFPLEYTQDIRESNCDQECLYPFWISYPGFFEFMLESHSICCNPSITGVNTCFQSSKELFPFRSITIQNPSPCGPLSARFREASTEVGASDVSAVQRLWLATTFY